jgi:pimeloyl-ACP methyl ester carboxylesterase
MTDDALLAHAAETRTERFRLTEAALWQHHGLRPTTRFIQLETPRIRLRVLEVGTGTPVLMVHGTVGPGSWASLIEAIGTGHRFIVLDRPGWGGSQRLDFSARPYREVAADILRGVLDALGIERAVVVGGSIGDVWALSLAKSHPSRVERVVLLGGGPVVPDARRPSFIRLLASPIGALIVRLPINAERTRSILRDSGHGPSLDTGRIPVEFIDWRVSLSNDTSAMRHERDMVRSIVRGPGWKPGFLFEAADLGTIESPTLMVYGTADAVGNVDIWRGVVGAMPHARLEVIDGAGHMPWFDDPQLVAGLVDAFLAEPTVVS